MSTSGRFTIPSESNFAEKTAELARLWGADAVRNSDGTQLDDEVVALGMKVYTAYFPTRAHNEWITLHMDETPQVYLLTGRVLAEADIVDVPLMDGFFEEQLKPNRDADPHKYWEVVDRTTNEVVEPPCGRLMRTPIPCMSPARRRCTSTRSRSSRTSSGIRSRCTTT